MVEGTQRHHPRPVGLAGGLVLDPLWHPVDGCLLPPRHFHLVHVGVDKHLLHVHHPAA
uniref:Uncharacterized protein n=1 Tax=Arundo donax TaxID=35708 RepID=A0A0A9G590_ARUDO